MSELAPCRSCDGQLVLVVDLGRHPAAGEYPRPHEATHVTLVPLRPAICTRCGLTQLDGDGPDEVDDPAAPVPTSSATIGGHARRFVGDLVATGLAGPGRRTLELASHGGYLQPFFAEAGLPSTIVEPSPERSRRLAATGVPFIELTGLGTPTGPENGRVDAIPPADLVVDHYLLSHLPRPRAALGDLVRLLAPDGWLVLEFDHLLPTVEDVQFDAIRHGHRSYLSLTWLRRELERLGLGVTRAERQPVYGGALRVWARRVASAPPDASVQEVLDAEAAAGIDTPAGLAPWAARIDLIRDATRSHLEARRSEGRPVVGYGAPARAVTFLNALKIGPDLLRVTADRAASKQGRLIPGVDVPIVAPERLRDHLPADVLVLAWDLAPEIRAALPWVEELGGRWLVAMPRLAELGPDGVPRPIAPGSVKGQTALDRS